MDLVVDKRMSPELRQVCAVQSDGTYLFARSYESEPWLLSELEVLERLKAIPRESERRIADIEEIRSAWSGTDGASEFDEDEESRKIRQKIESALDIAAQARASDLVIETDDLSCRIHAIINDRRFPIGDPWRAEEGQRAMRKLFFLKEQGSQQTSYQEREFQGFAVRSSGGVRMPDKVSGLRGERGPNEPAGEHMFLRMFYSDTLAQVSLEKLGFDADQRGVLERMCRTLRGATIIGGETGDGKSTTLATCLLLQQRIFGNSLNLVTVEDPVEVRIPGAVQLSVSTAATGTLRDAAFGDALRHFCRINPGSGMVSEIRDKEAARQVMRFVDTGHQVWTTIHAGDANGIVFRLLDLGVPVEQLCNAGNLSLLMKQTIVSMLCDECKRPAVDVVPEWVLSDLGTEDVFVRNAEGCESCGRDGGVVARAWAGYRGRQAVAEMILPDADYLEFVHRGEPNLARHHWVQELGGVPVQQRVRDLVLAGLVDPLDALAKGMLLYSPADKNAGAEQMPRGLVTREPGVMPRAAVATTEGRVVTGGRL